MLNILLDQIKKFESSAGDLQASLDKIASECRSLNLTQQTRLLLAVRELKDCLDNTDKVFNRNYQPLQLAVAHSMVAMEVTSVDMHGHRFTSVNKGSYTPPPKTKEPEAYQNLITWLKDNCDGAAVIEETTIKIGGGELSELCKERLEEGLEPPPGVREYNQVSIKVTKK